jgi:tRNA(Ile)-lysidine synthase
MKNSELCREVNSFLEQKAIEAEKLIITEKGYDCDKISELDDMLRDELLYILLKKYNIEPDRKTLALLSQSVREHKDLDIGSGYAAFCTQGFLRFHKKGENLHFSPVELKGKIQLSFNGKEYSFKEINDSNNNLIIRTREAGDRFTFKDRNITKSLKKLLIEAKIPKEKRDSLLLVADGARVIWLEDIGYAAHGDSICEVKIYNT